MFLTFMEDFNTATLPHVKYYDMEKWEKAQPRSATQDLSALNDEERLRLERAARRREEEQLRQESVMAAMQAKLRAARDAQDEDYYAVLEKMQREQVSRPTFETIAKKREEEKKAKEMALKKRF